MRAICSSVVPYLCMWAVATIAKSPGKVKPFHCSKGKSHAMAKYSVTSAVVLCVIFSTPPTMTTSARPERTANTPQRMAVAEEPQAPSVLKAWIGSKPAQSSTVGPA